jgi:ABC-type transport system involved in multi-copper enzyme maturation permease subunit
VAALPLVAVGTLSLFVTRSLGGELALGAMDFPQLGLAFLRTAFALLPDAALTLLLAVATRSPLATVGCGIGILLLGGNVVSGVLSQNPGLAAVGRYLPSQLSESLLSMNATAMKASIGPPLVAPPWLVDGGWAAALLAAYASVFVALAWLIFRRQDLHP